LESFVWLDAISERTRQRKSDGDPGSDQARGEQKARAVHGRFNGVLDAGQTEEGGTGGEHAHHFFDSKRIVLKEFLLSRFTETKNWL
jgi:hypothetical protein